MARTKRFLSFPIILIMLGLASQNLYLSAQNNASRLQLIKLFNEARKAQEQGNDSQVIELYKQIIAKEPNLPYTYEKLGTVYSRTGDVQQAINMYKKFLELKPNAEDVAIVSKKLETLQLKTSVPAPSVLVETIPNPTMKSAEEKDSLEDEQLIPVVHYTPTYIAQIKDAELPKLTSFDSFPMDGRWVSSLRNASNERETWILDMRDAGKEVRVGLCKESDIVGSEELKEFLPHLIKNESGLDAFDKKVVTGTKGNQELDFSYSIHYTKEANTSGYNWFKTLSKLAGTFLGISSVLDPISQTALENSQAKNKKRVVQYKYEFKLSPAQNSLRGILHVYASQKVDNVEHVLTDEEVSCSFYKVEETYTGNVITEQSTKVDLSNLTSELKERAKSDSTKEALCDLGYLYLNGLGVEQNTKAALSQFEAAQAAGSLNAYKNLAILYSDSRYKTINNLEKSQACLAAAVEQNDAEAMTMLADMKAGYSDEVVPDFNTAVTLYSNAAEKGNAYAMYRLGCMYSKGWGVAENRAKAFEYYQQAANKGCPNAICEVATAYRIGDGVKRDLTQAYRLYTKAAKGGDADAMQILSEMCLNGVGVKYNYTDAMKWANKRDQVMKSKRIGYSSIDLTLLK